MPVYAAAIDVGPGATTRSTAYSGGNTAVDKGNPANDTGTIDSVEIYAVTDNMLNTEVALFYVVSGDNLSTRSNALLGTVVKGSKQTFTGLTLACTASDYLGVYWSSGSLYTGSSGGAGVWRTFGTDKIPCTNEAFSALANYVISIYATGATTAGAAFIPKITWW